jgi:hypothetical protein
MRRIGLAQAGAQAAPNANGTLLFLIVTACNVLTMVVSRGPAGLLLAESAFMNHSLQLVTQCSPQL